MIALRNMLAALIALKLVYLAAELAFNGQLVLTLSRGTAARDVHAIELYGRIFSGLAAGLLVLRFAIQSREQSGRPGIHLVQVLLLVALPAVFVFFAQKAFINWAAAQSDAATRQSAQRMTLLAAALSASDRVPAIQGFDQSHLTPAQTTTLRALLGSSLYFSPRSLRFAAANQETLVQAAAGGDEAKALCRQYAHAATGFTALYNEVYRAANVQLSTALTRGSAPQLPRGQAGRAPGSGPRLMTPQERFDLGDEQFYKLLQTHFRGGPDRLLAYNYRNASQMMFGRLVDPTEFCENTGDPDRPPQCPGSRAFVDEKVAAFRQGGRTQASPSLDQAARARFDDVMLRSPIGAPVPPGLAIGEFERHPAVQRYLAQQMKEFGSVPAGPLSMGWKCSTVVAKFFAPSLRERGNARQQSFADGARYARNGRDAVRTLLTPVMSLGLSLFFGLLNLAGLFLLITLKFWPPARDPKAGFLRRHWLRLANIAIVVLVLALPFATRAGLSRHPGYDLLMSVPTSGPAAAVLRPIVAWILRVQPEMLPLTRTAANMVFPERLRISEKTYDALRALDRAVIGRLPGGEDMNPGGRE